MDWKGYYRAELEAPGVRERIERWLTDHPVEGVDGIVRRGGVLSFPHTALAFAGPLQAAVVSELMSGGVDRIIALGVLHSVNLPVYRTALDEQSEPGERESAFRVVSGAFVPQGTAGGIDTPFGVQPTVSAGSGPIHIDRAGLLADEFSLDTFFAILRLAADVHGRRPIPVLPIYVGMSRHPVTGSFDEAQALAEWLSGTVGPATAVVATGDLVHFGSAYGDPSGPEGTPGSGANRSAVEEGFRDRVAQMLERAMQPDEPESMTEAYRLSMEELKNDQREILPILAAFLGTRAFARLLHFELSDYAPILDVPDPCLVASALVAYG